MSDHMNIDAEADHRADHGISRRRMLQLFGAGFGVAGASAVFGAQNDAVADGSTSVNSSAAACGVSATQEIGPFYVSESGNIRPNVVDGQTGSPLTLTITIEDESCNPVADAAVDIWSANAVGVYSDESSEGTVGQKFLRGTQITNSLGQVTFATIVPGWYAGRTDHIHLEVWKGGTVSGTSYNYASATSVHIGQMFFDAALDTAIAAQSAYTQNKNSRTTNSVDRVYTQQSGAASTIATTGDATNGYTGTITVTISGTSTTPTTTTGLFTSTTPTRVLDTRSGVGAPRSKVASGAGVTVSLSSVIPATGSVAVVQLAAVDSASTGYLSAYAAGTTRPGSSNLNNRAGQTVANLAFVPLSSAQAMTVYNGGGATDIIADVVGYFAADTGSEFVASAPTRVLDTRTTTALATNQTRTLSLADVLPAEATAAVLNLTATGATANTYLTGFQTGTTRPGTSSLNVDAEDTVANLAVVSLGTAREISLFNRNGTVDVIADLAGYFIATGGSTLTPTTPTRVLDTRHGIAAPRSLLTAGGSITLDLSAVTGTTATAAILNLTATGASASTYITAYPAGTTRPSASTLNVHDTSARANLASVKLTNGKVTLYNSAGTIDLIADLFGYYTTTA